MEKLKIILTETFGVSENDIKNDEPLESIGLDSICIVEFQIEIEREFGLSEGSLSLVNNDTLQTISKRVKELKK
ncbi:acyl carrier protein [Bisgaard Taxon 10/6]|uniref:acyl carrier protein n=1 Tax=Exercitatus varius TaxID=67857 RepID=UPI00294B0728|nr:acyl carrier protein [Exercitatus varius]MDG2918312.1 acyl carrier protein [Exercitatus varius]MDG2940922.1 acyl carrier protein [Exercitatus varius]MDG2961520.1 acyl carrier protein [Exercitatus varius]